MGQDSTRVQLVVLPLLREDGTYSTKSFWVREFKIGQGRNAEMRLLKCLLNLTSPREFETFSLIIIVGTVVWG